MTFPTSTQPTLVDIAIDLLVANPHNLRQRLDGISRLAGSIREMGVLVPLIVTPHSDDGTYLVVAGHRRLAAWRQTVVEVLPCIVRTLTDAEQCETMLNENDGVPLGAVEEAAGYMRLASLGASVRKIASTTTTPERLTRTCQAPLASKFLTTGLNGLSMPPLPFPRRMPCVASTGSLFTIRSASSRWRTR